MLDTGAKGQSMDCSSLKKSLQGFYGQWQVVVDRGVLFGGYA